MSRTPGNETPAGSTVLWTGIWFALLAGFIEVAVLVWRRLDGHFIHRSRDFLWMTPLGYLLLFAVPLLVIWMVYRSGRLPFHIAVFLLAVASAGSGIMVVLGGRLHPAALLLLALGLGLQASRLARKTPAGFVLLMRRTAPWMLVLWGLAWAGTMGHDLGSERRQLSRLGASASGAPNIVLIILDTVRAASMSLYGYSRETTPELAYWFRRGVVFDNAISTAPWTLPSHASIFTGRLPEELSADWSTPLDGHWPTLAEVLRDHGYRTGGFVANTIYATWEHGLSRGFVHYEDYPFTLGMLLRHTAPGRRLTDARLLRRLIKNDQIIGRKDAERIGRDFLHWVDQDSSRPFFAFLNYYDAHDPYLPPQDYFRKFAGHYRANQLSPLRRGGPFARKDRLSAEDLRLETAAYDGAIAYLDTELGKLFAELKRRGILDRTLVIVTADHGEELGEHGVFFHGHTLYRQALHVPLMMLNPGTIPAGRRIGQTVSLRDLPSTIFDLVHVTDTFPGRTLGRFWRDSSTAADPAFSRTSKGIRIPDWFPAAHSDLQSVVTDGFHYIRGTDELIFDWMADSMERNNLVDSSRAAPALVHLRTLVRAPRGVTP